MEFITLFSLLLYVFNFFIEFLKGRKKKIEQVA